MTRGRWKPYQHLRVVASKVFQAVTSGKSKRIIFTCPPQHGKSTFISEILPPWYLGCFPDNRVLLGTYEADFAETWGRKARTIMEEFGQDLWGVGVDQRSHAADRWDIADAQGGMMTAGIAGGFSGKKGNLFIVDDPHKNSDEAASEVMQEKVWDFYRTCALTRMAEDGIVIVMHTRWHEGDLIGRLQAAMADGSGEKFEVINLPAIAEEPETWPTGWTRAPGDILCPELFSKETLLTRRSALGPYFWSALYQQRPTPEGGGVFKREWLQSWTYAGKDNELCNLGGRLFRWSELIAFVTVDLAVSMKTEADFTAIAAWAVTNAGDLILLDMDRRRMEGPDILPAVQRMMDRTGATLAWIEKTGFQLSLIQQAQRDGMDVRELEADRDKLQRAIASTATMDARHFWIPPAAPWLDSYVHEMLMFPKGKHDDMVDVTSYADRVMKEHLTFAMPAPLEPKKEVLPFGDITLNHDFSDQLNPPDPAAE